jgi:hypothetical protein
MSFSGKDHSMARVYHTPQFPLFEELSDVSGTDSADPSQKELPDSMKADLIAMRSNLTGSSKCGLRSTKKQRVIIISAYKTGAPISHLAEMTGFSMRTIRLILIKEGVQRRPRGQANRRFTPAEIEDIRRRWHTDEPRLRIAKTLNVSPVTLNRLLKEIGEDPRRKMPKGEKNAQWKGGRITAHSGYIYIHPASIDRPEIAQPMANQLGYVLEHRYVVACQIGRPLKPNETVHHINGIRADNRPENLQLRANRHGAGQALRCLDCGSCNVEAVPLDD